MKIRSLTIPDLHHFKNLELDFTYPKGHAKEGQALDKVCIIGQSGTGKTTLLRLLFDLSTFTLNNTNYQLEKEKIEGLKYILEAKDQLLSPSLKLGNDSTVFFQATTVKSLKVSPEEATIVSEQEDLYQLSNLNQRFFAEDDVSNIHPSHFFFPTNTHFNFDIDITVNHSANKKILDFSKENVSNVWSLVLTEIKHSQEQELIMRQEISRVAQKGNSNDIQKAVEKLEKWKEGSSNLIIDLANVCLNPLLKNFGLRVKKDLDIQRKEDFGFIKIEDFNGIEIPLNLLSTGTKQIILNALPLYLLKPNDTLIFMDEPELSLYPDVQRQIVEYYTNLAKNSQFFFATHSPIIASNFEPWEIVELKFDKDWKIYREKYYEGENHVENYVIDPRYLNYDLVLKEIFDLQETNSEFRTDAIVKVTMLKNQLEKLKSENNLKGEEGKQVFKEYQDLSRKLVWETV